MSLRTSTIIQLTETSIVFRSYPNFYLLAGNTIFRRKKMYSTKRFLTCESPERYGKTFVHSTVVDVHWFYVKRASGNRVETGETVD